jgi:hypothetical protein
MLIRPLRCAVATPLLHVMRHGRPNAIDPVSSTVSALICPIASPLVDKCM